MRRARTTICCSAVALAAAIGVAKTPEPPTLVPARTVWSLALNNQLTAPPAYDDERVYFSIEHDRLVAYDLAYGSQQWLVDAKPVVEPAAGGELVFVAEANAIVARSVYDGSVAWQIELTDPPAVPPVWNNGWLVVAQRSGDVLGIRAANGEVLWTHHLAAPPHARPTLAGESIYIATDDARIVALQTKTGAPLWERRLGGPGHDILAAGDRLYVGSLDNFFYCLMPKDGRIDWRWRTGGDVTGLPAVDGRRVYFVSLDNVLRALDQVSGGQVWMKPLPQRPVGGPALAAGSLVTAGLSATLKTFNVKDGSASSDIGVGGEVAAPLHAFAPSSSSGGDLPLLLVVSRDLVKGASVTLLTRSVDPPTAPIAPLPNPVMPVPTPATPPR